MGAGLALRTSQQRIEHLRGEIASFFRARAAAGNPAVARARSQLEEEVTRLRERAAKALHSVRLMLDARRKHFIERMEPLLKSSVIAVKRQANEWNLINWATLRAIVTRDGVFKSPSTGRTHNLNEDITSPLLNQLPVAWQHYFGTELGQVRDEFSLSLAHIAEDFAHHAGKLMCEACGRDDPMTTRQLESFRKRIEFDKEQCAVKLSHEVSERRRTLAFGMVRFAKTSMQPAYENASGERGSGMKSRMLGYLQPRAVGTAPQIYQTIEHDIRESLVSLEAILGQLFEGLAAACIEQANLVAHNVNIDLDSAQLTPELRDILTHLSPETLDSALC